MKPEMRQAALLAEGVAHALVGEDHNLVSAIDCFDQIADGPESNQTRVLRQQAAYNKAVVWAHRGCPARCVLLLTELLGERAPDTVETGSPEVNVQPQQLDESVYLMARLARLAASAAYTRVESSLVPPSRIKLVIDDGENLIPQLAALIEREDLDPHDRRLANYMYVEALRALGHLELESVIVGSTATADKDKRSTRHSQRLLREEDKGTLCRAIKWMLRCEQLAPDYQLFCDLAEAYLLLGEFGLAQGYTRHATLENNPQHERGYYLATEICFVQNTDISKALARKYAQSYKGTVTLEEFKSLRKELGVNDEPVTSMNLDPMRAA